MNFPKHRVHQAQAIVVLPTGDAGACKLALSAPAVTVEYGLTAEAAERTGALLLGGRLPARRLLEPQAN